ncbi:MAG: hypothetical protein H7A51_01045 [Akkermansiaceae bacterium]|nr:hypothetical protein [Akkermansiaceae bacterium]
MHPFKLRIISIAGSALLCFTVNSPAEAASPALGGMQLLKGYEHKVLQGIDSRVGIISKKDGLQIHYEIGSIPKPGSPGLGGQFSDRAKLTPKQQLLWYREQTINGQPVHLAHCKDGLLLVSFPQKGTNFRVQVNSPNDMADALLMILTYPENISTPATTPDQ